MAYELLSTEPLASGVKRIALEEIESALSQLGNDGDPLPPRVHQTRRHLKQIRALLRLVRYSLGDAYPTENETFRDIARTIAGVRDAQAVLDSYDRLRRSRRDIKGLVYSRIRRALVRRRDAAVKQDPALSSSLQLVIAQLTSARDRVVDWPITGDSFDIIEEGLIETYRRGRRTLDAAARSAVADDFHEWRKHVKDHWYHLRILQQVWPEITDGYRSEVKRLADFLGEHHDLHVLIDNFADDRLRHVGGEAAATIVGAARARMLELELTSERLGRKVFAEGARAAGRRIRGWWEGWKKETSTLSSPAALAAVDPRNIVVVRSETAVAG